MTHRDIHVVPHGDQWAVIREGDGDLISLHASQPEAEDAGRELATDGGVAFASHPRDGGDDVDPRLSDD